MKKVYLLLFLISPYFLAAQSFSYQTPTGLNLSGPDSMNLTAHIKIFNMTSTQLQVMCKVAAVNLAPGHAKYFCFGPSCYDTSAMMADDPIPTNPGKMDSVLAYLTPNHLPGSDDVTYQFYDVNGNSDTLTLTVHYSFSSVGISEINNSSISLNTAAPNPANNLTAISYSVPSVKDARLVFYNLLGSAIKEIKLTDKQGIAIVETSQLNSGIYFYSLVIDGNPVASKKLIIAHK